MRHLSAQEYRLEFSLLPPSDGEVEYRYLTGIPFHCACGQRHAFDPDAVEIVQEFAGRRLLLACPRGAITCVALEGPAVVTALTSIWGHDPKRERTAKASS